MSLPVFFILLTTATLLAALAALFASLRTAFGGTSTEPLAVGAGLPDRAALDDEKNSLLRALKDLEYEHEVGKIADADYERLERAYRLRAKQVLADLDRDLGPYLSQAEALVARSLGERKADAADEARPGKKSKKKAKAEAAVDSAKPASAPEPAEDRAPPGDAPADADDGPEEPRGEAPSLGDPDATIVCAKCTTRNDADASFCKRCAAPLAPIEPEASV